MIESLNINRVTVVEAAKKPKMNTMMFGKTSGAVRQNVQIRKWGNASEAKQTKRKKNKFMFCECPNCNGFRKRHNFRSLTESCGKALQNIGHF